MVAPRRMRLLIEREQSGVYTKAVHVDKVADGGGIFSRIGEGQAEFVGKENQGHGVAADVGIATGWIKRFARGSCHLDQGHFRMGNGIAQLASRTPSPVPIVNLVGRAKGWHACRAKDVGQLRRIVVGGAIDADQSQRGCNWLVAAHE